MPGRSSLRTTSMWLAGGRSMVWSSGTDAGLAPQAQRAADAVLAAPDGDQVHVVVAVAVDVSRTSIPRSAAMRGALT